MDKTKALRGLKVEVKDASEGTFRAVFSTFNAIDHDGDVTTPGAFKDGQEVRISAYNHASWGSGHLPVGKGTIHQDDSEAWVDGQFFLNTAAGRETFEVVKAMGSLQEWSYGFDVLEGGEGEFNGEQVHFLRSLDVHEVSPVLLGAGINTRTLAAKARGMKLSDHLDFAVAEIEVITKRVADAVAQRAEKGQQLAEATRERAAELLASIERLREALAIEPQQQDDTDTPLALEDQAVLLRARENLRRG